MALNKFSQTSDKVANLYRAAFYLAKGSNKVGLEFLDKSGVSFEDLRIDSQVSRLYWAEKILDEYLKLKQNGKQK